MSFRTLAPLRNGAVTTECPIRSTQEGSRCDRCGARWDRDDEAPPCPHETATRAHDECAERSNRYMRALSKPERLPFASGLPFSTARKGV